MSSFWQNESTKNLRDQILFPTIVGLFLGVSALFFEGQTPVHTAILIVLGFGTFAFLLLSFLPFWNERKWGRRILICLTAACCLGFLGTGFSPLVKKVNAEITNGCSENQDFKVVVSKFTSNTQDKLSDEIFGNLEDEKLDLETPSIALVAYDKCTSPKIDSIGLASIYSQSKVCLEDGLFIYGAVYDDQSWNCKIDLSRYSGLPKTVAIDDYLRIKPAASVKFDLIETGRIISDVVLALLRCRKDKNGPQDIQEVITNLERIINSLEANKKNRDIIGALSELLSSFYTMNSQIPEAYTSLKLTTSPYDVNPLTKRNLLVLQYKMFPDSFSQPIFQDAISSILKEPEFEKDQSLLFIQRESQEGQSIGDYDGSNSGNIWQVQKDTVLSGSKNNLPKNAIGKDSTPQKPQNGDFTYSADRSSGPRKMVGLKNTGGAVHKNAQTNRDSQEPTYVSTLCIPSSFGNEQAVKSAAQDHLIDRYLDSVTKRKLGKDFRFIAKSFLAGDCRGEICENTFPSTLKRRDIFDLHSDEVPTFNFSGTSSESNLSFQFNYSFTKKKSLYFLLISCKNGQLDVYRTQHKVNKTQGSYASGRVGIPKEYEPNDIVGFVLIWD